MTQLVHGSSNAKWSRRPRGSFAYKYSSCCGCTKDRSYKQAKAPEPRGAVLTFGYGAVGASSSLYWAPTELHTLGQRIHSFRGAVGMPIPDQHGKYVGSFQSGSIGPGNLYTAGNLFTFRDICSVLRARHGSNASLALSVYIRG